MLRGSDSVTCLCGGAPVVINCSKSPYCPKDERYMPICDEQCFLACCHVVDGVFSVVAVVAYKLKSKDPTFKSQCTSDMGNDISNCVLYLIPFHCGNVFFFSFNG